MIDPLKLPFPEGVRWYCVRTKRFLERAASIAMREEAAMDVFCPMIRFERARSTGKTWVTEALFPNYLFACFDYSVAYRQVQTIRGVMRIVGFGGLPVPVPSGIITELRDAVSEKETIVVESRLSPGEEIEIVSGPFRGLKTIITRVLPAKQRVAILLEILGTEREVEIDESNVIPEQNHPLFGKEISAGLIFQSSDCGTGK